MKQRIRQRFFQGLMLIAVSFSLFISPVNAAGETAYLTPASGKTQTKKTFTVSVDGYVSQSWFFFVPIGANKAQGSLSFPAQNLRVKSISNEGTAFPNGTPTYDNAAGTINFNISTSGSHRNKTVHLFSVTFETVNPGTANVAFGTTKYNIGTAATTGGTYTVTAPPAPSPKPTPKPTTKPKPSPSTKPKPSSAPKPSIKPTPSPSKPPVVEETPEPVVESDGGLEVQNVQVTADRHENKVTWSINNDKATPTFTYGPTKNNQSSQGELKKNDDGSYSVVLPDLKPGTLYHFTIRAATKDNLQGANYSGTLTTRGFPVQLTIQQNNLLLPGAKVRINERSFVANKDAIITTELSEGKHTAQISPPGSDEAYTITFTVSKKAIPTSGNPDLQSFMLNVTTLGSTSGFDSAVMWPIIGAVGAGIAIIAAIAGFVLLRRRQQGSEPVPIDSDLLASNYGRPVESFRQNTPDPNLDALGAGPDNGIFQDQPLQPAPQEESYTPPDPSEVMQQEQLMGQMDPTSASIAPPQISSDMVAADPTSLPPPPPSAPPEVTSYETEPDIIEPTYSEEEQLSTKLAQVEAGDTSELEASAVYHESTGELEIVHHRPTSTPTPPVDTPPSLSDPVPQVPTAPIETGSNIDQVSDNDLEIPHDRPSPSPQTPLTVS